MFDQQSSAENPRRDWLADRARYSGERVIAQPALWAIAVYRFGRWTRTAPLPVRAAAHALYFAAYSVVRLATGIDIPRGAQIGPGLMIHHFGGVIVNPRSTIGSGLTLRQGVTIGTKSDGGPVPRVGNNVELGAYAQVLGDITVGDNALIGAMSLVIHDVPAGATAAGNPARVIGTSGKR